MFNIKKKQQLILINAYDGDVENLDATIDFTIDLLKRFASCQYHEVLKY